MFKKLLYDLLYKTLEIVFVAFLGYGIYLLIDGIFAKFWAVVGLTLIFYFFSPIIKPYIDNLRIWIYGKIVNEKD